MSLARPEATLGLESTVTSKGQVTLPSELRKRLGLRQGSRVRFSIGDQGAARLELVRHSIADVWRMADEGPGTGGIMSFEEMDRAKVRQRLDDRG